MTDDQALSWLPARSSEDLDADAKRVMAKLEASGSDATIFRLLANSPSSFVAFVRMADALLSRSTLPADVREAVVLCIAVESDAAYEWAEHEPIARRVGVTPAQIARLAAGDIVDAAFTSDQRLAMDVAARLVRREEIADENWEAVVQRFGADGAVDLFLTVGWWGGMVAAAERALRLDATSRVDPRQQPPAQ